MAPETEWAHYHRLASTGRGTASGSERRKWPKPGLSYAVRRLLPVVVAVLAGSTSVANATIVVGRSIGGVAPGMSRSQVEARLGKPLQVVSSATQRMPDAASSTKTGPPVGSGGLGAAPLRRSEGLGRARREGAPSPDSELLSPPRRAAAPALSQRLYGGGILVSYTGRVATSVAITDASHVTRSGIGVGTREGDLTKKLGGERCLTVKASAPTGVCIVDVRAGRRVRSMQFIMSGEPRTVRSVLLVSSAAQRATVPRAPGTAPKGKPGTVVVNTSVAGIHLGMRPAQIERKLGRPVETRASTPAPGQRPGISKGLVERLYAGPVTVLFENDVAASIVTRARGHRTSRTHVGVGSLEKDVRRLAGVRCVTSPGSKSERNKVTRDQSRPLMDQLIK